MQIVIKKIEDLKASEYNPRFLSKEAFENLKQSLERFGFIDPVIVNMFPGRENRIVGGHQRTEVWKFLGNTEVPCVIVSLDLEMEKQLNIRLNRNSGEWDMEILTKEFDKGTLLDWGFNEDDFKLMDSFKEPKQRDENNYNKTYTIVFNSSDDKQNWLGFIQRLGAAYPDQKTITERLMLFTEKHLPKT